MQNSGKAFRDGVAPASALPPSPQRSTESKKGGAFDEGNVFAYDVAVSAFDNVKAKIPEKVKVRACPFTSRMCARRSLLSLLRL